MNEYLLVQNGATEFFIAKKIGELYHTIGRTVSRDYGEQIVAALLSTSEPREIRRSWSDV